MLRALPEERCCLAESLDFQAEEGVQVQQRPGGLLAQENGEPQTKFRGGCNCSGCITCRSSGEGTLEHPSFPTPELDVLLPP